VKAWPVYEAKLCGALSARLQIRHQKMGSRSPLPDGALTLAFFDILEQVSGAEAVADARPHIQRRLHAHQFTL
jgi:hypothetical protein